MTSIKDILNPPTYWVGNRCYRVLTPNYKNYNYNYAEEDTFSDDNAYDDEMECGVDKLHEYDIQQIDNGKYKTSFHVPSVYYAYIIGSKGATKKRLEQESGCSIIIPPRGVVDDIVITSRKIHQVRNGRLRVELLVDQARCKLSPTHYIEFLANTNEIQDKFLQFKDASLKKCGTSRGFVEGIFQRPIALHITLGVLTLVDDYERVAANEALNEGVLKVSKSYCLNGSFTFRLKGLHYMNDDPGEVSVLYAGVEQVTTDGETDSLQTFVDGLVDHLTSSGLMTKTHDREHVKLHMTVINTKYLLRGEDEDDKDGNTREKKQKTTFDARDLLEQFGDYDFGVVTVTSLQLSVRHAKDNSATKVVQLNIS